MEQPHDLLNYVDADQIEVLLRDESNQILDYDQNSSESLSDNQSDNEISSSDEERNGQGLQYQEDEEEMEFNSANMIEYVQNQDQDQVYEPQIDIIADGDGSKTTYESCSSNNSDESPDVQQKVEYSYKEQECQQIREFQDHEELQQNQEMPEKIKSISFLAQEQPVLFKTLRLNELQQARIIQFEEFEPYNNSNRQDAQLTGGRFTSQASTSNRLSLSKTFNFQMAIGNYCESQSSADSQNLPESTRDNIIVSEREKLHNELTMKVDEKI